MKIWEKKQHASIKAEEIILVLDKEDLKAKKIIRDRGSLHNNKGLIHLAVFSVCTPNNRASKAIKQNPTELKEK